MCGITFSWKYEGNELQITVEISLPSSSKSRTHVKPHPLSHLNFFLCSMLTVYWVGFQESSVN